MGVPHIPQVLGPTGSLWSAVPGSVLQHTKHWPAEQATRPVLPAVPPRLLRLTFWVEQREMALVTIPNPKEGWRKAGLGYGRERFGCWRVRSASGMLKLFSPPPGCL